MNSGGLGAKLVSNDSVPKILHVRSYIKKPPSNEFCAWLQEARQHAARFIAELLEANGKVASQIASMHGAVETCKAEYSNALNALADRLKGFLHLLKADRVVRVCPVQNIFSGCTPRTHPKSI